MADFPFEAVIFDMDGVLVDTEWFYLQEMRAFAVDEGVPTSDEELKAQVGASHQSFRRLLVSWYRRIGRELSEDEAEERFNAWSEGRPRDFRALMNPGVPETMAELKRRGVRLALASSSKMDKIKVTLDVCDLKDVFEAVVSGEQFRESKPEPDIYLHALELLGLPASVCCCVEDSVPGITAGKRSGLTVVAKRETRFGFSQDAADVIIDQIPDLLDVGR